MFLKLGSDKAAQAASEFDNNPSDIEKFQKFAETCVPYFSKKPFTLMQGYKEDWNVWIKNAIQWSIMDYRDDLKKSVQCPTLILAGEDDPNHPLASSTELAHCIPEQFRHFEVIANAGAPVYQDQPEAFNKAVSDFLKKIMG
jgi:pimeloyl-ACP methyl ester carboxylesterase